jgi:hypothetical protein
MIVTFFFWAFRHQISNLRKRSALSTTESDEALMAKAAKIGLIRMPKKG